MNSALVADSEICEEVWQRVTRQIDEQVVNQIHGQLREQVANRVADRVRNILWVSYVDASLGRLVWDQADEEAP